MYDFCLFSVAYKHDYNIKPRIGTFSSWHRLINFNGIATHLGIFYTYMLGNRVHYSFIVYFFNNFALGPIE